MNECIWYNVQINIIADSILNNLNLLFLLFLLSLNIVNFNDNNFTTQSLDDRNWRLLKHTDALVTRYPCAGAYPVLAEECREIINRMNGSLLWRIFHRTQHSFALTTDRTKLLQLAVSLVPLSPHNCGYNAAAIDNYSTDSIPIKIAWMKLKYLLWRVCGRPSHEERGLLCYRIFLNPHYNNVNGFSHEKQNCRMIFYSLR